MPGRRLIRSAIAAAAAILATTAGAVSSSGAPAIGAGGNARATCLVPGLGRPLSAVWRPGLAEAVAYVRARHGDIAFAVRTETRFAGYRSDHQEWSGSVLTAMLLAAYLDRRSVAARDLTSHERALLAPMIARTDNRAADAVAESVGTGGLQTLAARVGMTHFTAVAPIWAESEITARDQTRLFLHIDRDIAARHRSYAMGLLSSSARAQRWGIGAVAPQGWRLYLTGGWGTGTGLIDDRVALLVRGCARISIAVLTTHDGSHADGQQTLAGAFRRLLAGLPTGRQSRFR